MSSIPTADVVESYGLLTSGRMSTPKSLEREKQKHKKIPGELENLAKEIDKVIKILATMSASKKNEMCQIEQQYQNFCTSFNTYKLKILQIHDLNTTIAAKEKESSKNSIIQEHKSSSVVKKIFSNITKLQLRINHCYRLVQSKLKTLEDGIKDKKHHGTFI